MLSLLPAIRLNIGRARERNRHHESANSGETSRLQLCSCDHAPSYGVDNARGRMELFMLPVGSTRSLSAVGPGCDAPVEIPSPDAAVDDARYCQNGQHHLQLGGEPSARSTKP